ncbi:MAG: protein kinase [Acidobacteriota bacterium]
MAAAMTGMGISFHRLAGALLLALALAGGQAQAQVQWYEHYLRGLELEKAGAWEEATRELEAALRGEARPRKHTVTYGRNYLFDYDPHYHLARCFAELSRLPRATLHLRLSYKAGVTPRPLLDALRARIEGGAGARPPTPPPTPEATGNLVIASDPPGARASLDGRPLGATPLGPVPVAPGEHLIRLEAAGFVAEEHRIEIAGGATYNFDRSLRPSAAPAPTSPARPVEPTLPTPTRVPAGRAAAPTTTFTAAATPVAATPPPVAIEQAQREPAVATGSTATPSPAAAPAPTTHRPGATLLAVALALAAIAALFLAWRRRHTRPASAPTYSLETSPTVVRPGGALGQYELTGLLGRGGMATTYRARRGADGSQVALKVPHEGCLADPSYLARFLREGKLGEQLHHPRIVRIFEAGEHDGRPYLAMELLAGVTLKELLRQHGALPAAQVLRLATDIAEALDYAHVKGVVHRDLKPENVMVMEDGTLKVMDFGIARLAGQEGLTTSQYFLGTPLYAAPEMIEPKQVDHRADLYALGIIMFEMLQGTVPFVADSPFKVLQMHQHEPLPPRHKLKREVPEPLWRMVERLCAKDPAARYQTAEALLVELHQLLRNADSLA